MSKKHQHIGLVLGLAAFVAFTVLWRDAEHPTMGPMAGIAALMAVWWISEAVPLPVTALLPIALFPCLKIMSSGAATSLFFNKLLFMAILLFIIPSKQHQGEKLMDWDTTVKLPWGILLLFGGGFALAGGFTQSGLSQWIGESLHALAQYPHGILVGGVGLLVTFLTELTSNMATTSVLEPILAGIAKANGIPPLLIMIPAALSASFAFMLPVATAPNAIVFASGYIPIRKMVCAGIVLNLIGVMLVVLTVLVLTVRIFS